ncbi:hypothetical protein FLJC2902T_24450 [Flavobacterium limnosediminis JC2902]|uniref:Uncharacterized protein n=1 Tax=Flavobacterium limnosediminis JC2902 TaxID=1341181 RepID=V6SIR3_9FLAO|nr:hypothetical protein FLJC2902T_24450 [Flavobacterium limnosediminis JC2902]
MKLIRLSATGFFIKKGVPKNKKELPLVAFFLQELQIFYQKMPFAANEIH